MKRFICLFCAVLLLSLAACGKKKAAANPTTPEGEQVILPTVSPDTPADAVILSGFDKMLSSSSFVITVDTTTASGDATALNTEVFQTVGKFQDTEKGFIALFSSSEGDETYLYGGEIYTYPPLNQESLEEEHTKESAMLKFFSKHGFHEVTLEEFLLKNPKRSDNSDGSITYSLDNLSVADYAWLVLGKEMSDEEADKYVNKGCSLSFTVDAAGYLSRAEVIFNWETSDGDQVNQLKKVFTTTQFGEDLQIQTPEWVTG